MFDNLEKNLRLIQENIVPYSKNIRIIAVTKYYGKEAIIKAYNAGMRDFGESRVVESVKKIEELPREIQTDSTFHMIGHLQSNKVSKAVMKFDYIHSVDTLKIAELISEESLKIGKIQKILLQVNNAGEVQKTGFSREELFEDFERISSLKGIKIVGLMNMAPFGADEKTLEKLFAEVVSIRDEIEKEFNCKLPEISMGMSGDK